MMKSIDDRMISRRELLGMSLSAGAALALSPTLLAAIQKAEGKLIQRPIAASGELLPIISFGARPVKGAALKSQAADVAAAKGVLKTFLDNGGKVVDVLHGGPAGEYAARTAARELDLQDKFFWTTPLQIMNPPGTAGPPLKPKPEDIKAAIEEKFATLKVSKIDLVMVPAHADVPTHLAVLNEMKKEGRIRYIGVHELLPPPNVPPPPGMPDVFARLESIMRNEAIDFIGTDYSVGDRRIEEKILPLAQERKISAMAYFPFDRNRIFKRANETPLPAWAADFDATTWAQFFLKYVASHPAITLVRTGTTKPEHMLDNIAGGIGRLPDEATRKRMAAFVDALPPTPPPGPPQAPPGPAVAVPAAILDRYVGEYKTAAGSLLTFRREGATLFIKPGNNPEVALIPNSETRFADPRGPVIEFQLDGTDKVTGIIVEQGTQKIPASRIP